MASLQTVDFASSPLAGPAPSPGQLRWLAAELGLFCHFGINTFFGKEWSDGTLPAAGFNPTDFSARQWVDVALAGGFRYLILTAKHHDGFCLWPTDTTDYSVRSSPWRGGRGDVVAEVAEACRERGLAFGLYLSPWDRHEPCYPDAHAYDDFYARQLTELCTRYGELFELWFDGAGSEGRVYDWGRFMNVAETHQPRAMIFNMGRPTIRWVGNEDGLADDPNYLCVRTVRKSAFTEAQDVAAEQAICVPAECDVAIRQNWFWQPDDLDTLKSADHLLAIYYRSVGMGSNLLLNMGVDRRGRISDEDALRWSETRREIDRRFRQPAAIATLTPVDAGVRLAFAQPVKFDHLILREDLTHGQQIDGFTVLDPAGRPLVRGRTIGYQRILPLPCLTVDTLKIQFTGPAGTLSAARVFFTGTEGPPSLGPRLDYTRWAEKADGPIGHG